MLRNPRGTCQGAPCRMISFRRVLAGALLLSALAALLPPLRAQESPAEEAAQEAGPEEEAREDTAGAATVAPLAERFRPFFEGRVYLLRMNLHKPEPGGHPAPWMDAKGWHRRDVSRPVVLGAGERVQVTGIFDYGDRSVFVELTRWPVRPWNEDSVRTRIRLKAGAGPEKPEKQDEEIRLLLALLLRPADLTPP